MQPGGFTPIGPFLFFVLSRVSWAVHGTHGIHLPGDTSNGFSQKGRDAESAEDLERPSAATKRRNRQRHRRACPGGAMILHYGRRSTLRAAPTELDSVERMIVHREFIVTNHASTEASSAGAKTLCGTHENAVSFSSPRSLRPLRFNLCAVLSSWFSFVCGCGRSKLSAFQFFR
jgi:hypothetical protein